MVTPEAQPCRPRPLRARSVGNRILHEVGRRTTWGNEGPECRTEHPARTQEAVVDLDLDGRGTSVNALGSDPHHTVVEDVPVSTTQGTSGACTRGTPTPGAGGVGHDHTVTTNC